MKISEGTRCSKHQSKRSVRIFLRNPMRGVVHCEAVLVSCVAIKYVDGRKNVSMFLRYLSSISKEKLVAGVDVVNQKNTKAYNQGRKDGFVSIHDRAGITKLSTVHRRLWDGFRILACVWTASQRRTTHSLRRLLKASDTRIRQQYSPRSITCRP